MEINRREEDKVVIERDDTGASEIVCEAPTSTDTLSLSFSSDRFMFNESPDEEETVDCINKSRHLFADFKKKKSPTLEEALKSMEYGDEKAKKLSAMFLKRADEKLKEFETPGLTS